MADPNKGMFNQENPSPLEQEPQSPFTLDDLVGFVEELDRQGLKWHEFLRKVSEKDLKKVLPDTMGLFSDQDERGLFQFSSREELEHELEKDGDRLEYGMNFVIQHIIEADTTFCKSPVKDNKIRLLARENQLKPILKQFMGVMWGNRGKSGELAYPSQEIVQKVRRINSVVQKRVVSEFGERSPRERETFIIGNLDRLYEGENVYGKIEPLFRAGGAAENLHKWYITMSYLAEQVDGEDFAHYFVEALEGRWIRDLKFIRNRRKRVEYHDEKEEVTKLEEVAKLEEDIKLVSKSIGEAAQEWFDALKDGK